MMMSSVIADALRMAIDKLFNIKAVIGKRFLPMGHFQLFSMILKFSMGHFLSFYTDFDGPFSKLMGLWRMTPCLPNHCIWIEVHIFCIDWEIK